MTVDYHFVGFDRSDRTQRQQLDDIETGLRMLEHAIAPEWLQRLDVHRMPEDDASNFIDTATQFEQHRATIRIHESFWGEAPRHRWNMLIHEMIHVLLGSYTNAVEIAVPEHDEDGTKNLDFDHIASAEEFLVQEMVGKIGGYLTPPGWAS